MSRRGDQEVFHAVEFFTTHADVFQRRSGGGAMTGGGVGSSTITVKSHAGERGVRRFVHEMRWDRDAQVLRISVGEFSPRVGVGLRIPTDGAGGGAVRVEYVRGEAGFERGDAAAATSAEDAHPGARRAVEDAVAAAVAGGFTLHELIVAVVRAAGALTEAHFARDGAPSLARRSHARVAEYLSADVDAADAMISLFYMAVRSTRRSVVCIPCPQVWRTGGASGGVDYDAMDSVMSELPAARELASRARRTSEEVASVPAHVELASWILHSARSLAPRLVRPGDPGYVDLPRGQYADLAEVRRGSSPSPVAATQVMLHPGSGSAEFHALARKHGTVRAFHGSAAENMHSIVRNGLRSMSNSSLMRTGAVFGDGVYLSTDLSVALSFTQPGPSWPLSSLGTRVGCVAVCDVALHPDVVEARRQFRSGPIPGRKNSAEKEGTYLVVGNERHVRVHSLLFLAESTSVVRIASDPTRAPEPQPHSHDIKTASTRRPPPASAPLSPPSSSPPSSSSSAALSGAQGDPGVSSPAIAGHQDSASGAGARNEAAGGLFGRDHPDPSNSDHRPPKKGIIKKNMFFWVLGIYVLLMAFLAGSKSPVITKWWRRVWR